MAAVTISQFASSTACSHQMLALASLLLSREMKRFLFRSFPKKIFLRNIRFHLIFTHQWVFQWMFLGDPSQLFSLFGRGMIWLFVKQFHGIGVVPIYVCYEWVTNLINSCVAPQSTLCSRKPPSIMCQVSFSVLESGNWQKDLLIFRLLNMVILRYSVVESMSSALPWT